MATHRAAKNPCRILLLDDHPLTRHGIAQLVAQQSDMVVCGEAGSAEAALDCVRALRPNLVLVDVTLPGKPGLEFIKDLTSLHPEVMVLVVSMHDESLYAERALRAGARGYLMKEAGGERMLEEIPKVLEGQGSVGETM